MIVDRAWFERNIGFDPIEVEPPPASFAFSPAAQRKPHLDDLQRDIIEFDSEGPEGAAFLAFTKSTGLGRFTEIPWPSGLAPKTGPKPAGRPDAPLPRADVLVVTWTVDEGHALSRVLTPGKDSRDDYAPYGHNFASISRNMSKGSPAMKAHRLGAYWPTTIAGKTVLVFKSDSHLSQDTNHHLPPDARFCRMRWCGSRSLRKCGRVSSSPRGPQAESARISRSAMSSSARSFGSIRRNG